MDAQKGAPVTYRIETYENLIVLTWLGVPEVEGVKALEATFERLVVGQSRKVGFATVVHPEALNGKVPAEVRTTVASLLRRYSHRIAATVVIYENRGIKASIVRTIIMTINLLSRTTFPSEVHAHMGPAITWLVATVGKDAPADAEHHLMRLCAGPTPGPGPRRAGARA